MDIKELFSKAENGTLNYEQFVELAKAAKAKFVDLSEGNYVDKQKYLDEISARDTRVSTLEGDLNNLKQKLEEVGADSKKFAQLTTEFEALKQKYETDTANYKQQLQDQAYKYAVNEYASQHKFTSNAAKRDFINSLLAKKLPIENDRILGADDFVSAYRAENADAFASEAPTGESKPKPQFVSPTEGTGKSSGQEISPIQFDFLGVRPKN